MEKGSADTISSPTDDGLGPAWKFWNRRRYIVASLAFFGFFGVYALRVNLSVAIVAMNSNRTEVLENGTTIIVRDFDWDSTIHGMILSSFFYGYIVTQILGGWLANRWGGNIVYGIGLFVTAFFTILTPPLTNLSVYLLVAIRVIEGLFEGVTYPCMHAVWSRWAPSFERSHLASFAASGSYVGTVVAMPMSGFIAEHFGWPWIFYIFGAIVIVWCILWWTIVKSGPEEDPKITPQELKYIQDSLGSISHKDISHPWKEMLTSLPVWAIVVAHFSENWGFYTLLTQLPTFMNDVLKFNLEKSGFMSALPYLLMSIVLQFSGRLADWLMAKGIMTTTMVRKSFNCAAFMSQMLFMLLAAFLLTPAGVVSCLSIAVGLGAFSISGYFVNHLDIAPQHASVLMGITNTAGTLPGMLSPIITGIIVRNKEASEWQKVFFIASAIYLAGAIFYGIFASGELQSWAKEDNKTDTKIVENVHSYDNKAMENDSL